MLEIDCQITSDGEVVVTHDNHLSRTTGSPVDVSETAYKVMFVNHVIFFAGYIGQCSHSSEKIQ